MHDPCPAIHPWVSQSEPNLSGTLGHAEIDLGTETVVGFSDRVRGESLDRHRSAGSRNVESIVEASQVATSQSAEEATDSFQDSGLVVDIRLNCEQAPSSPVHPSSPSPSS